MAKARLINARFLEDGSGKKYMEFSGSSSAEKPVNDLIATGSMFHEVDTKKIYAYNEDADSGSEWVVQMTLSEE